MKQVNLLGGDYGAAGAEWETLPAEGRQRIVAGRAEIGNPEPWATLNQPLSFNYWFTKFEEVACFDLSKYSAIQFDLVAPAGSNMNFTMTQRSANCSERLAGKIFEFRFGFL